MLGEPPKYPIELNEDNRAELKALAETFVIAAGAMFAACQKKALDESDVTDLMIATKRLEQLGASGLEF